MSKTKSIGNSKLFTAGIVLAAMITVGVLLIRPEQVRASTGDEPQLFLEANVGDTYLSGQTISLSATADGGEIFDGPIYSPDQSFKAVDSNYECSALAGIAYEDQYGNPKSGYFEDKLMLTLEEDHNTPKLVLKANVRGPIGTGMRSS